MNPAFSGLRSYLRYEDSEIELNLVDEDIVLQWAGGVPGTKVGYIIERKPAGADVTCLEIDVWDCQAARTMRISPPMTTCRTRSSCPRAIVSMSSSPGSIYIVAS